MAIKAEEVFIEVDVKSDKATKGFKETEQKTEGLFKSFKRLAGPLAIGATVAAFGKAVQVSKQLIDTYSIQEQAEARLEQTIKATGSAAGLTARELTDMATELQGVTKFGDEAIIGAESLLLTFKEIGEDVFPRALESILDVSEGMGQDLKSSTVQLGKALNDPIGGIAALTRVGIQFTTEQKDMIKVMTEAGDVAGAQAVILGELEGQFGGLAKAAGETATASFTQLSNAIGDMQEEGGALIAETLAPMARWLTDISGSAASTAKSIRELRNEFEDTGEVTGTLATLQKDLLIQTGLLATQSGSTAKNTEALIAAINNQIAAETQLQGIRSQSAGLDAMGNAILAEQAAATELAAEAELKRTTALAEYLTLVNSEFAKTHEGQIQAIQDEITMWENYALTAVNTSDEVEAILENRKAALDAMLEKEEEFAGESESIWDSYLSTRSERQAQWVSEFQESEAARAAEDLAREQALQAAKLQAAAGFFGGFSQLAALGASESKELYALQKGLAAAEAGINSALAFTQALTSVPFPFNIAAAAGVAAAGIAQQAQILSAPAFATGGDFMTSGPQLIQVGDNPGGRERVTVTPESSPNVNGPQGGGQTNIIINDEPIFTLINKGIRTGQIDFTNANLRRANF